MTLADDIMTNWDPGHLSTLRMINGWPINMGGSRQGTHGRKQPLRTVQRSGIRECHGYKEDVDEKEENTQQVGFDN